MTPRRTEIRAAERAAEVAVEEARNTWEAANESERAAREVLTSARAALKVARDECIRLASADYCAEIGSSGEYEQ